MQLNEILVYKISCKDTKSFFNVNGIVLNNYMRDYKTDFEDSFC